jgi:uncharacterized protein
MKKILQSIFVFLFVLSSSTLIWAQSDLPARPVPAILVNDFTQTLNQNQINHLERKLASFSNASSNQILVLITNDLQGYDVVEYADIIGQKWGVGQEDFNNGIVVLVKPKTAREKGQVRISVGYGLDGAIPDAITNRIIDHEMIPSFKQNDYYSGIEKSTNILMSLAEGEFSSDEYAKKTESSPFGLLVPVIAILFFVIVSRLGGRGGQTYGRGSSLPLWTLFFLGSSMGSGRHHGSWGNFSGGSGGFGGGGGGGFGGFGGGGFGGGGASGSW